MIVLLAVGREADEPTYDANSALGVMILTGGLANGGGRTGTAEERSAAPDIDQRLKLPSYAAISAPSRSSAGDRPRRVYWSKKQRACSRSEGWK
jgi:hypothetical protein